MDEEQQQPINVAVEDNNRSEAATDEANLSEVQSDEAQMEGQPEESHSEEPDKKPVRGAEKRIHQLVDKVKTLESKLNEYTGAAEVDDQYGGYPDFTQYGQPTEQGQRELTVSDLQAITRLEIEKEKTISRINSESKDAMTEYPELDPESQAFNPELSEIVTESVLHAVKANPRQSVKQLVNKYMKPYKRSVEDQVDGMREQIVKQVSDTALRPTGTVSKSEKSIEDMTIEEIEAKYGTVR